ncbi:hypothetical protein [Actinokineospora sp. HUAS TT18]|uniref:hypothetical protein n=1 Tax=Actinokineospora sp. HUAS TT18 TaxID=3447451 RepID=UPI003F52837F
MANSDRNTDQIQQQLTGRMVQRLRGQGGAARMLSGALAQANGGRTLAVSEENQAAMRRVAEQEAARKENLRQELETALQGKGANDYTVIDSALRHSNSGKTARLLGGDTQDTTIVAKVMSTSTNQMKIFESTDSRHPNTIQFHIDLGEGESIVAGYSREDDTVTIFHVGPGG